MKIIVKFVSDVIASPQNIIGIITVFFNIIFFLLNYFRTNRMSLVTSQERYFVNIFDEFLMTKIPQNREYLRFNDQDRLTGIVEFCEVLTEIGKKSLYFKYSRPDFYSRLKNQLNRIEDYVMMSGNKTFEPDETGQFYGKINAYIEELYFMIFEESRRGIRRKSPVYFKSKL